MSGDLWKRYSWAGAHTNISLFFLMIYHPLLIVKYFFQKQVSVHLTVFLKILKKFFKNLLNIENNEDGFAVCSGKDDKS